MAECEALAEIATILGLPDDAALLRQRQKELGDLINKHMYVPSRAVTGLAAIVGCHGSSALILSCAAL